MWTRLDIWRFYDIMIGVNGNEQLYRANKVKKKHNKLLTILCIGVIMVPENERRQMTWHRLTIRNRAQGFSGCAPLVTYRVPNAVCVWLRGTCKTQCSGCRRPMWRRWRWVSGIREREQASQTWRYMCQTTVSACRSYSYCYTTAVCQSPLWSVELGGTRWYKLKI